MIRFLPAAFWLCALCCIALPARADGPADNDPSKVRPIPPPGIEIPDEDRQRLEDGLARLAARIDACRQLEGPHAALLPDVEIFHRAVDQALTHSELFAPNDLRHADLLLQEGLTRAEALLKGETPWTRQTGLVVRGYRSRLDETVQPYGLLIPASYDFDRPSPHRCDLWFHGRGEKVVELQFIAQRMTQQGAIAPEDTIVLHPFGRYSNAFKFAGEVDVFEALDHARSQYRIDDSLIAVRGFSMGGAGCWHFAVHHPDRFFAATPGAGFSETPEFLKSFQGEKLDPPEWEERLWQWYDAPGWVANLRHCPTIAYSGEIDRQKQAADVMVEAFRQDTVNELELLHVIGPQTAHKIHPDSLVDIERRLAAIAAAPRRPLPRRVRFCTFTLKYNRLHWLTINGLERHWDRAEIDARLDEYGEIEVHHRGVTDLTLQFPPGSLGDDSLLGEIISPLRIRFCPLPEEGDDPGAPTVAEISEDPRLRVMSDGSFACRFRQTEDGWQIVDGEPEGLRKRPGLQGPIDDAFMDSFLFVVPSGKALHPRVGAWVQAEQERAVARWRRQMRGDVRIKTDAELTPDDIARHHLILWGDPQSNSVLGRVLDKLPLQWTGDALQIGDQSFDPQSHVSAMIYPNPLNPDRYVVLNSGFTYREYDDLNNARQTPKLPDWAVIDLSEPPGPRRPGKIAAADFFDERWRVRSGQ